jgi:hypothetical protein
MISGNAQLLKIHEQKDSLADSLSAWKKCAESISKRMPAWQRLKSFHGFAVGLPEAAIVGESMAAIDAGRALLTDPDPIPELTKQLKLQDDLATAFTAGEERLAASPVWGLLSDEQRDALATTYQLSAPSKDPLGSDEEILAALQAKTLTDRSNLLDAVPQRFSRALDEASRLMEPKAQRLTLPGATLKSVADLDQWLAKVRAEVEAKLQEGPVIL